MGEKALLLATHGNCQRFKEAGRSGQGLCPLAGKYVGADQAGCYCHLPRVERKKKPVKDGKQVRMEGM